MNDGVPPVTGQRGRLVAVGAAYAAQGFGYATVVTALPALKDRVGIDEATVALLLLGTCAAAALGSVLADLVAVRWGSRQALVATAGTAAVLAAGAPAWLTLVLAAVVVTAIAAAGVAGFAPERAARRVGEAAASRTPLPRRAIWAVGALVFAAFVVDAAVSSWSTLYLADGLGAAPGLTPLGYGAYLVAVLAARLAADPAVRRFGRARVGVAAVVLTAMGALLVAVLPVAGGAIAGFALMGAAAGALVPIAFSRAGELLPERSDEVIARVNLFNYGGAVAGAVTLGLVAAGPALGPAFLIPAAILVACAPLLRAVRASTRAR